MSVGVHVPLRFLRAAMKKGVSLLKAHLPASGARQATTTKLLEPVYAHIPRNTKLHPALRQKIGGRWYSTTVKNFLRVSKAAPIRAAPAPAVRSTIARSPATPFATALRPRLVGGAFPRTATGYSLGGGARYFSHAPAPAQVMQQVSTAMRAFLHSSKGQMDGFNRHRGSVNSIGVRAQLAASLAQENAPGAYIDFDLTPTLTSISPFASRNTLENVEFLENLSADLHTAASDMAAINADIRRLAALGDLPVSTVGPTRATLRVHFRGCDQEFVENLCREMGVSRGIIHEDEHFTFGLMGIGYAGSSWQEMMSEPPPLSSTRSDDGFDENLDEDEEYFDEIKSRISGSSDDEYYFEPGERPVIVDSPGYSSRSSSSSNCSAAAVEYEGVEGIHRFLEFSAGLGTLR